MPAENKARFLEAEGLELMVLVIKAKKFASAPALKQSPRCPQLQQSPRHPQLHQQRSQVRAAVI